MREVGQWTTGAATSARLHEPEVDAIFQVAKSDVPLFERVNVMERAIRTKRFRVSRLEHAGALFHALNLAWDHWPENDPHLMEDRIRPVIRRIMGIVYDRGALHQDAVKLVSKLTRARLLERWLRVHTLYRVDPQLKMFEQWVEGMVPVLSELSQFETTNLFLNLTRLRVWPPAAFVGEVATVLNSPGIFKGECGRFRTAIKEGVDRLIGTHLQGEETLDFLQQIRASAVQ